MSNTPAWMREANSQIGLRELPGSEHEQRVLEFFREAGHPGIKDDETAWCAAFANSMLYRAGIRGTGMLTARSFLEWGEPLEDPIEGCIVVLKRGTSAWQGHVGFFVRKTDSYVWLLGGNQSNSVSIARYPLSSLLGYRWPSTQADRPAPQAPTPRVDQNLVLAIQRALSEKGYHEVGRVDGLNGPRTRAATLAFLADNNLPLEPTPSRQLLADILAAPQREISPERLAATEKDLRGQSRIVDGAANIRNVTTIGAVAIAAGEAVETSGILDSLKNISENAGQFQEALAALASFVNFAVDNWWIVAIAIGFYIFLRAGSVIKARVEDHREGRTP